MLSLRGRIRAFHTFGRLAQAPPTNNLYSFVKDEPSSIEPEQKEEDPSVLRLRGKKKAPGKQNLVILNAKQSNIFHKLPNHTKIAPVFHVLDPIEFETSRKRLLQFKSEVPLDQIISSIQYIKPDASAVSAVRYRQIKDDIASAYSISQLKEFIKKYFPDIKVISSLTKKKTIEKILKDCWKLEESDEISSAQDLLIQRSFDLSPAEIFILLAQNPMTSWLRANVQVIMIPSDRQLIVRASAQHVAYIEMALSRIFHNIVTGSINLEQITELYKNQGEDLPLDVIQRLSGVYMEKSPLDTTSTSPEQKVIASPETTPTSTNNTLYDYNMSALGRRRFSLAKRLMLWALDFNPFVKTNIHIKYNKKSTWFKNILSETMPWIHKNKTWVRLRAPKGPHKSATELKAPEIDYQTIHNELNTPATSNKAITDAPQSVIAVNFGHLLYDESTLKDKTPQTFFQTTLPHIRDTVHSLETFGEIEEADQELVSADRHEYHAQIKLVPSPFNNAQNYLKYPPLEFWIEINDKHKGDVTTLQVLRIINEQNSIVSLPNHPCDLKFLRSDSEPLLEGYNGSDDWLADQPGIKDFLKSSNLDFSGRSGLKIADYVDVKMPGTDEVIRYDYVTMAYRKHLTMDYKGKLLQYSIVEGGRLGGRTSEALLVGKVDEITLDEFKEFVDDSVNFTKQL